MTTRAPPVLIFQVNFPLYLKRKYIFPFWLWNDAFVKEILFETKFSCCICSLSLSAILYKGMIFPFQKRRIFYSGPRQWFAAWVALKVIAHSFWFSTLSSFIARQVCALPCLSITCFQRDLSFSLWPIALRLLQNRLKVSPNGPHKVFKMRSPKILLFKWLKDRGVIQRQ